MARVYLDQPAVAHDVVAAAAASADVALSPRERDVWGLLAGGHTNKEIAQHLGLRPKTVMHYASSLYRKLGVRGRVEAVVVAASAGLVTPSEE